MCVRERVRVWCVSERLTKVFLAPSAAMIKMTCPKHTLCPEPDAQGNSGQSFVKHVESTIYVREENFGPPSMI